MKTKIILGSLILGIIAAGIIMKIGVNSGQNTVQAEESANVPEVVSQVSQDETKITKEPKFEIEDLTHVNSEGDVEVQITFMNPMGENEEYWIFETAFNTHIVDLEQYDFSKLISFSTDEGVEIQEDIEFKTEGAGHHIKQYIQIPKIVDGKEVITNNTKTISIQVKDVDNIPLRTFAWDMAEYSNTTPSDRGRNY